MTTGSPLNSQPFPVPRMRKHPSLPCLRLHGPGRKLSSSIASAASVASTSSSRSRKLRVQAQHLAPVPHRAHHPAQLEPARGGAGFGFEHPRPAPKPCKGSESDDSGYAEALYSTANGMSPHSLASPRSRSAPRQTQVPAEPQGGEAVLVTEDEGETEDAEDAEDTPRPLHLDGASVSVYLSQTSGLWWNTTPSAEPTTGAAQPLTLVLETGPRRSHCLATPAHSHSPRPRSPL